MKKVGKWTELQVGSWFISEGWDVFVPMEDTNALDLTVYDRDERRLSSLQIKGKELDSLNQGQFNNDYSGSDAPYHYLIFYQALRDRGFIFPHSFLREYGKTVYFFKDDRAGYSTGEPRDVFVPYFFDLSDFAPYGKGQVFVSRFRRIRNKEDANHAPTPVAVTPAAGAALL